MHGFAEAGFFDLASFSDIAFAAGEALGPCEPAPPRSRRTRVQQTRKASAP